MTKSNLKIFTAFVVGIMLAAGFSGLMVYGLEDGSAGPDVYIEPGSGVETASYIIYQDGDYTCAKNGTTGRIDIRSESESETLQYAIDNAQYNGTVFIAGGMYVFDSTVYVNNTANILGAGVGSTFNYYENVTTLYYDGTGDFIVFNHDLVAGNSVFNIGNCKIIGNALADRGLNLTGVVHSTISDVEIKNFGSDGIYVEGGADAIFTQCVLHDNGGYGLNFIDGYLAEWGEYGFTITGCIFHGNTAGNLVLGSGSVLVLGNTFENSAGINSDHILLDEETNGGAVIINSNIFANSGADYNNYAINIRDYGTVIISSNIINVNDVGIYIGTADRVTIDSNTISGCDNWAISNTASNDVIISNNYIKLDKTTGGGINNAGVYGVLIGGNQIYGNIASALVHGDKAGIYNTGAYVTISDNVIEGVMDGINNTGEGVLITNNNINSAHKYGIISNANRVVIDGNFIICHASQTANTYSGVYLSNAKWTMVQNNYITGQGKAKHCLEILNEYASREIMVYDNEFYYPYSGNPAVLNSRVDNLIRDNVGYVTNSQGRATITSPDTTVVVTHGLVTAPVMIILTPQYNAGHFWVSAINATSFTINVETAPGSTGYVSWEAYTDYW